MAINPARMEDIVRRIKGEPNQKLTSKIEWRYGKQGSLAIKRDGSGDWYDHENQRGGGPREFIEIIGKERDAEAWYDREIEGRRPQSKSWVLLESYDYLDEECNPSIQVRRFDVGDGKKTFLQYRPDGKGGWLAKITDDNKRLLVRLVLYHTEELHALRGSGEMIFVVEGEKDVDRLREKLWATCNPMGAGSRQRPKWHPEFSTQLEGFPVCVLGDNDPAGREHAASVVTSLLGRAEGSVRVLELAGLPEKGDVSDWLNMGHTHEELVALAWAAPELSADQEDEPGEPPADFDQRHAPIDDTVVKGPWAGSSRFEPATPWLHEEEPIEVIDLAAPAVLTPRRWLVPGFLPIGETCLFSGEGARGKTTIAQQLGTVASCGLIGHKHLWLGREVTPMPTLMVLCEDRPNDVMLRQEDINRHYGCHNSDLNGLFMPMARRGKLRNELAYFDRDGAIHLTSFYDQLIRFIRDRHPRLIILDTRSDLFWGNQNDERHARMFIRQVLDPIADMIDGTVIMLMHPSMAGKSDGGSSGSVQWANTGRAFAFLTDREDGPEDEETGRTGRNRLLTLNKGNFSPRGQELEIRWHDGIFKLDEPDSLDWMKKTGPNHKAETAILAAIDRLAADTIGAKPNPRRRTTKGLAAEAECAGIKAKDVEAACAALEQRRLIEQEEVRINSYPIYPWRRRL